MTTEQLALLPDPPRPLVPPSATGTLRIPDRARRLGLAGVAQARQVLDEAARRRAELDEAAAAERTAGAELAALERAARRPERSAA